MQDKDMHHRRRQPDVLVIAGPSGCGKSTVARLLSQRLGCVMLEGDDFHSQQNIGKMRSGIALTDEDRWPWLVSLRMAAVKHVHAGKHVVIACSALKKSYRDYLQGSMPVKEQHSSKDIHGGDIPGCLRKSAESDNTTFAFVLLDPPEHWLQVQTEERAARGLHYMPSSLLLSQLAILERGQPEEWLCHITDCKSIPSCSTAPDQTAGHEVGDCWPPVDQIVDCILHNIVIENLSMHE